jgi:hypothetical protein
VETSENGFAAKAETPAVSAAAAAIARIFFIVLRSFEINNRENRALLLFRSSDEKRLRE